MKLFIWNDKKWDLIEANAKYESDFVVVRKLFVQLLNLESIPIIQEEFAKFGQIEGIELITTTSQISEFYISFKISENAYNAFNTLKNSSSILTLVPADTWRQPSKPVEATIDSEQCVILKLNDDCLVRLFKCFYLYELVELSHVCTRFRDLLHEFFFPKVKTYTVYTIDWPLLTLRRTLQNIGSHLVKLHLNYQYFNDTEPNYLRKEYEQRITQIIVERIGDNLQELIVSYEPTKCMPNELIQLLAPILQKIHKLRWNVQSNCSTISQLRSICPKLESLNLKHRRFTCVHSDDKTNLPWPSLKYFENDQYFKRLDINCAIMLNEFIKSNPQLERIKLENVSRSTFEILSNYSINLKYLELIQNHNSILTLESFNDSFENLQILIIREKSTAPLAEFVDRMRWMKKLTKLKLVIMISNCNRSIGRRIKYFPFAHKYTEVVLNGDKLRLVIGTNSMNIDLATSGTMMINVFNTGQQLDAWKVRRTEIMDFILKIEKYFPLSHRCEIFKNSDCCQFIHVSRTN